MRVAAGAQSRTVEMYINALAPSGDGGDGKGKGKMRDADETDDKENDKRQAVAKKQPRKKSPSPSAKSDDTDEYDPDAGIPVARRMSQPLQPLPAASDRRTTRSMASSSRASDKATPQSMRFSTAPTSKKPVRKILCPKCQREPLGDGHRCSADETPEPAKKAKIPINKDCKYCWDRVDSAVCTCGAFRR